MHCVSAKRETERHRRHRVYQRAEASPTHLLTAGDSGVLCTVYISAAPFTGNYTRPERVWSGIVAGAMRRAQSEASQECQGGWGHWRAPPPPPLVARPTALFHRRAFRAPTRGAQVSQWPALLLGERTPMAAISGPHALATGAVGKINMRLGAVLVCPPPFTSASTTSLPPAYKAFRARSSIA